MKACIKFIERTVNKCSDTNQDVNLALLQIRLMPIEPGLPNLETIQFSRPISGRLLMLNREPTFYDYDNDHHVTLKQRQDVNDKNKDTLRDPTIIPTGSVVAVHREDSGSWTHGTIIEHDT